MLGLIVCLRLKVSDIFERLSISCIANENTSVDKAQRTWTGFQSITTQWVFSHTYPEYLIGIPKSHQQNIKKGTIMAS